MIRPGRLFYPYITITLFTFCLALIIGNSYIFRAALLWIGLLIIALLWSIVSLKGLSITRTVREKKIDFGQIIYESHYITNNSYFPKIQLEIVDNSRLAKENESRIITSLAPHATLTFSTMIEADQRGLFDLGPTLVRSIDIFGLFSREILIKADETILIWPPILDVQTKTVYESFRIGGRAKNLRRPDETLLPTSIRDQLPGDSLKRIHWPSTAKHQKLMVREYDSEPQADGFIIVNCNKAAHYSETKRERENAYFVTKKEKGIRIDSMEYQVCIAGTIAKGLLQTSSDVGLFLSNAKSEILPPDQGERQISKILDILSLVRSDGELPLREYVLRIMPSIPKNSKLYILTSTLEQDLTGLGKELIANGYLPELLAVYSDVQSYDYWQKEQKQVDDYGGKLWLIIMDGNLLTLQNALNSLFL